MNSDAFFAIGSGHRICEDYAIAGEQNGRCYGIISDGCSSSKDTDIGSRLLVRALQQTIPSIYDRESAECSLVSAIYIANSAARVIGLPETALDATLGLVIQNDHAVDVLMYGDGVIVYKPNDRPLFYQIISYHNNAPGYLSYLMNRSRRGVYLNNCSGYKVSEYSSDSTNISNDWPFAPLGTYHYSFDMRETEFVAILSDGVESFKDKVDRKSAYSMIEKFTAFKNTKGEFVQRRCKRALRDLSADGIVHEDDFSMACIVSTHG